MLSIPAERRKKEVRVVCTDTRVEIPAAKLSKGAQAVPKRIRSGKIACRVYRKEKFHAKAYITHARLEVIGSSALVGSSNFTYPGLTENVELNVQITGQPVGVLQEWYEEHWAAAEDVTA
jgi:phosphatidylserine/phosphatidylglycerophosphate/cardiolipin synthase-like enzyme